MWSNQENRVRKQVKNPCEARKIKASQILHKIISTQCLIMEVDFCPVDQMAWVRADNQHRAIAEEIILKELIYI